MNENSRPLASCPPPALIEALQGVVGERVTLNRSIREHHGHDESWHDSAPPDAVCFPESTEEVARIAKLCCEHRIPMIPFGTGTGTGVAGSVNAVGGGMTIDLSRMDRLLSVYADDFSCQAGLTYKRLNEQLCDTGLFFSVDPGADASVGGLAATRASGTNTVKYGSMRENVLSLTAVLADGRIIKTGSRASKSAAGYDLTQLFIGSEGTLGVITELIVKLHDHPAASASASVQFPDLRSAVDAVIATLQHNVPMARIELVDEVLLQAINRFSGTRFEPAPSLFVEFQGSDSSVREDAETFGV